MGKIGKQIILPGELLPYERVDVFPKVSGYVRTLDVDIGSPVIKGQRIAVIDAPEVKSKLGEGIGELTASEAKYQNSLDNYNRMLQASKTEGVISASELQRAKSQMREDSGRVEAFRSTLESYSQVGNYLVIKAPFTGVVTQRNVNTGSFVGTDSKPIIVIEDISRLRMRVAMPEALTGLQVKDNKVQFSTKAMPNQFFAAFLVRKAGSIDAATRTEIWEFEVDNRKKILKSGSYCNVALDVERDGNSFVVPSSSVVTTMERQFVIRIKHDSVQWVDIMQGLTLPDKNEVFGSLFEGDTLVVKGNEELKTGKKVFAKF